MRHFPIAGGAARHRFCRLPRRGGGEKAATANRRRRSCLVGKGAVPPGAVSRSAGNALWLPPEKPSSARGFGVIPPCVCRMLSHGKQRCFAPLPKRLGESAALRVGKCRISRMKVRQFEAESAALFTGASDALFSAVPNPSPARLAQGVPAFRRTYKYTMLYDVMFFGKSDIHPRKRGRKSLDFILRPPAMAYREPSIARSHSAPFHTEMSAFPPRVFRCLFHGDSGE